MIRRLSGTILDTNATGVILDVQGIGYLIFTNLAGRGVAIGDTVTFYTHLSVRETALDLYGFTDSMSLRIFELLITIPKIGPKSALQILEQADVTTIVQAGKTNDPGVLIKLAGIGKKTAERIVAGLHEKAEDLEPFGIIAPEPENTEAIDTLIALGYSLQDAREALRAVDTSLSLNEQIRAALKQL